MHVLGHVLYNMQLAVALIGKLSRCVARKQEPEGEVRRKLRHVSTILHLEIPPVLSGKFTEEFIDI